jgi:uncharacterized protein (TIGR02646 family)
MVRLDRCKCPDERGWKARVQRAFPKACAFWKKARAFEKLALNGAKRRGGFVAYAGETLPAKKKATSTKKRATKGTKKPLAREFPALWRQDKRIVEALASISKGHCAYCQKFIRDELYVAVEHFQPKNLFPLLAYAWENYLPSCGKCNSHKLDRWPLNGAYVRPDDGSDPTSRFVFDEKGRIRAARADDEDARATIKDFGLNRRALRKMRWTRIKDLLRDLREAAKLARGDMNALRLFFRIKLPKTHLSEFSEAIRQMVLSEGRKHGL